MSIRRWWRKATALAFCPSSQAIAERGWQGQFNFDFLTFLVLSARWSAWRFGYGVKGWALAVLAFFGGMPYLATTLFCFAGATAPIGPLFSFPESRLRPFSRGEKRFVAPSGYFRLRQVLCRYVEHAAVGRKAPPRLLGHHPRRCTCRYQKFPSVYRGRSQFHLSHDEPKKNGVPKGASV